MNENQFSTFLAVVIPSVIALIVKSGGMSETEAISKFYRSKLYQELSDEETKLWHYGPMTLYTMYCEEVTKGFYEYPEES